MVSTFVMQNANLIFNGEATFVREIRVPGLPGYYFRVLTGPKYSESFIAVDEPEVRYNCGDDTNSGDENCHNKEDFRLLLKALDRMREKIGAPMEGKVVERQQITM